MLSEAKVCPTIGVSDLARAKDFYEGTLGLSLEGDIPGGVMFGSDTSGLFIYETQYAGTNKATYASWNVDNIEECIEALKAKGVSFEHYDLPGAELQGDIHVMDGMKSAWFKDPDGNILAINQA